MGGIAKTQLAVKLPLDTQVDIHAIRQEAELWSRAGNHPHVLPIFEADIYDGQIVIVSEYAPDGSLAAWLVRHGGAAPSLEAACQVIVGVLAGLEHLHVRGIIHRDLKPANILLQSGTPRLADFGLARLRSTDAQSSLPAGTPIYMAPEAFDGKRTAQTDIWAAGVVLYQLLAGRPPFATGELTSLVWSIMSKEPDPLPSSVPAPLREVVQRALEKNAARRYPSAADMRSSVRDAMRAREGTTLENELALRLSVMTIAITGSMHADRCRAANRVRTLAKPYCGPNTTWYCGANGNVDEAAGEFLLSEGQRVVAIGYGAYDISHPMRALLQRYDAPFVDAQKENVPDVPGAPSHRDVFFSTKTDLVIMVWDGKSYGIARLSDWLRRQGRDHLIGYV
jgi:tRNA A-37 threonylcarbamoyl transferase component Bud32